MKLTITWVFICSFCREEIHGKGTEVVFRPMDKPPGYTRQGVHQLHAGCTAAFTAARLLMGDGIHSMHYIVGTPP